MRMRAGRRSVGRLPRGSKLREHIALVFHRFLDAADTGYPTVAISVNDVPVTYWNPFYPEKSEQVLPDHARMLPIQLEDGSTYTARMNAWILPHSKDLTKEENALAKISSRAQGFSSTARGASYTMVAGWVFSALTTHTTRC